MKVARIMMQNNEHLILSNWVGYHGAMFGFENLYIFDNGSDNAGVRKELDHFQRQYNVNVDYSWTTKPDYEARGDLFIQKIRALEESSDHDFFIPLDCDEFICVQDGRDLPFSRGAVTAELEKHRLSPRALKIVGCYYNCYGRKDYYYYLDVPKTFFATGAAGHLDQGYHDGTSRLSPDSEATALRLMHFHNKPFQVLKAHAEMKLRGRVRSMHPYDLKAYRGAGQHLIRYFFMTEADYLDSFPKQSALHIPEFALEMEKLGVPLPF